MTEVTTVPRWGTIAQAAETLGVSTKTIRRMAARGEIDARRFGARTIRVDLDSIGDAGRPIQYIGGEA